MAKTIVFTMVMVKPNYQMGVGGNWNRNCRLIPAHL